MSYIIQFNQSSTKTNKMLDDHLHVINVKVAKNDSIDEMLAEFFNNIQEELDAVEGKKIRARKPELFEKISETTLDAASRAPDSSVLLSSSSNLCFVLMPFGEKFDDIYRNLIRPAVIQVGLNPLRADEILTPGSIVEQIRSAIQQSKVCIADLTGRNSNVFYELGIAQTLAKPIILLSQDISDVPFDVRHLRIVTYANDMKSIKSSYTKLTITLQQVLGNDRIEEVRRLIQSGMYRAAAAMLGILLEQSMRTVLIRNELIDSLEQDRYQRLLTMGKMVQMLFEAQLITKQEAAQLRNITSTRNNAVHGLKEPDKLQVETFFSFLQEFIQKYMI